MNDILLRLLSQSAQDFQNVVWPIASTFPIVGGGKLRPVEAVSLADFKDELDLLAGIDAWQIDTGTPMIRGLASRVQWGTAHNTFSIRYKLPSGQPTEFEKRLTSIKNKDNGHIFPFLTIQAYLSDKDGDLLSCAVIKTEELFKVADMLVSSGKALKSKKNRLLYGTQTMPDKTEFIYLSWDYLEYKGVLERKNTSGVRG